MVGRLVDSSPLRRAIRIHGVAGRTSQPTFGVQADWTSVLDTWAQSEPTASWCVDLQRPATVADLLAYAAGNIRPLTSISSNCYGDHGLHMLWLIDDEDARALSNRGRIVLPHWVSDGDLDCWSHRLDAFIDELVAIARSRYGWQIRSTNSLANCEVTDDLLQRMVIGLRSMVYRVRYRHPDRQVAAGYLVMIGSDSVIGPPA